MATASGPIVLAHQHWLVKLPRGTQDEDRLILQNEAAYWRVADACRLRTLGAPMHHGRMLFVPRFDRVVRDGVLHRNHQESLASLAGMRGFGMPISLFKLIEAFRPHVTDPVGEVVEFIKRDILNMAMRNTDNHARNTAVQRLPDGTIQLTPIFDFAPMYMDPEFIVRGCRWQNEGGTLLAEWGDIVGNLSFDAADKRTIALRVKRFQATVERLPEIMRDADVDARIIDACKPSIDAQAKRLQSLNVVAEVDYGQAPKAH